MNEIKIFENEEFGQVRTLTIDERVYFVASDIAKALGYSKPNNAVQSHCRATLKRGTPISGKIQDVNFIPEGDVYRLIMKSKLPSAEKFESWVMDDVLPSIRKHGVYMTEKIIEKALSSPDFLIQLATQLKEEQKMRRLAEQKIESQNQVIIHKQEVINGLTDDIDIYKKRDVINRICKRTSSNYANRYKEMYKCFRESFHIDLEARCEGYNLKQIKKKDRLSVIKYAEQFGHIDSLFECCAKLYETEVQLILEELCLVQS